MDIHINEELLLDLTSHNGHDDIVRYLIEQGLIFITIINKY
jgi:hypothetical protein